MSCFAQVATEKLAAGEDGAIAIGPFGSSMKADLYTSAGVPVARGNNIGAGRSMVGDFVFVSEQTARRLSGCALEAGDLFFPHRGAIGEVGMIQANDARRYLMSTSLMKLRVNPHIADAEFVFWFFKSAQGRSEILQYASTVETPRIGQPLTSLRSMRVPLPTLREQQAIAAVLGALDDKIELNRRMNRTLGAMARALFRSWFVDFDPVHAKADGRAPAHMDPATAALFPGRFGEDGLPEGWRAGQLGNLAESPRRGLDPAAVSPATPYIGLEHMPRRCIALSEWGEAGDVGSAKSEMRVGEFLFGKLRPYFHKVGIVPVDGICSTDIVVVRPKPASWAGFVLCVISSDPFVEHTDASSAGTKMPRTNWADMARFEIAIPPDALAATFDEITGPWRRVIVANIHQSRTLAALRDALLPKLMTGELRVRDGESALAEAV